MRRYIRRNFDEPIPVDDNTSGLVPASDRTVQIDHNSNDYRSIDEGLQKLEKDISTFNDYPDETDKDQRIAELNAGRTLLKATRVRADAIFAVLYKLLTYISKKFSDNWIGAAATALLAAIGKFTSLW